MSFSSQILKFSFLSLQTNFTTQHIGLSMIPTPSKPSPSIVVVVSKVVVDTIQSSTFSKVDDTGGDFPPLTLTWWPESNLHFDLLNVLPNPPTTWPFIKPLRSVVHDPPSIGGPSSCHVWCIIDTSSFVRSWLLCYESCCCNGSNSEIINICTILDARRKWIGGVN